jgi:carboxyl-terminal processing protease
VKITTAKYYIPSGRCIQAVDFSHPNEDGSVGYIPDSLINTFKTRNGREVKDGGGIIPDVTVPSDMLNRFTSELYVQNMIFDFATEYYWSQPQPPVPDSLKLKDRDIERFAAFLTERKFSYRTESETLLEELVRAAGEEDLYSENSETIEKLKGGLSHSLDEDLSVYRNDVAELIESELAGRYFYDSGMVQYSLSRDSQVKEAVSIAGDKVRYKSLLSAPAGI